MLTLRFCTSDDAVNRAIRARSPGLNKDVFPFMPSHVELLYNPKFDLSNRLPMAGYIGAHLNGGVQLLPQGYDKDRPNVQEHFVTIHAQEEQAAIDYAKSRIGSAYDWRAILGFVLPTEFHEPKEFICSALMTMTLRHGKILKPLPILAHAISPRDLLLTLYGYMSH